MNEDEQAVVDASEGKRIIDCDQVAQIMWALDNVAACAAEAPTDAIAGAISELESLLGIMRALNLAFEDASAAGNALYHLEAFDVLRDSR